jgi:hypothetical protein
MRHRTLLAMSALLAVATSGCDKIKGLLGRKDAGTAPPTVASAPDTAARDTTPVEPAPPPPPPPPDVRAVEDVPYVSADTGTVAPGMTERDIYAIWGPPAAVRRMGEHTYLYFHNGCEKSCGTMDLVILQNGQVVDAIVRWPGHGYSGESSSPPGRVPFPTRGDLAVPPPPVPADTTTDTTTTSPSPTPEP